MKNTHNAQLQAALALLIIGGLPACKGQEASRARLAVKEQSKALVQEVPCQEAASELSAMPRLLGGMEQPEGLEQAGKKPLQDDLKLLAAKLAALEKNGVQSLKHAASPEVLEQRKNTIHGQLAQFKKALKQLKQRGREAKKDRRGYFQSLSKDIEKLEAQLQLVESQLQGLIRQLTQSLPALGQELKGIEAQLSALLQKAGKEKDLKKLVQAIVQLISKHVSQEHAKGHLKTQALMEKAFEQHRKWLTSMMAKKGDSRPTSGEPVVSEAVVQQALVQLDAQAKSMVASYFNQNVFLSLYKAKVEAIKSAHKRGLRQEQQGQRYEQQGKLETAQERYGRAVEIYQGALKEFPVMPQAGSDAFKLYQAVQQRLQAVQADLARISGDNQVLGIEAAP